MASDPKSTGKSALEPFSEPVRRWFEGSFAEPTPAQALGWPHIAAGDHTLICAPTGSGKTLAAFLWGIDRLARRTELPADAETALGTGVRIVYVSPLKALSYDIERNLRAPLTGIGVDIAVGLRTGDTPQKDRQAMRRKPPDILITTPESLYLMMTSAVREILTGVEAVIVDEIHAVAQSKRGAHLALTLERLSKLVSTSNLAAPASGKAGRSVASGSLEAEEAAGMIPRGSGCRRPSGRSSASPSSSSARSASAGSRTPASRRSSTWRSSSRSRT